MSGPPSDSTETRRLLELARNGDPDPLFARYRRYIREFIQLRMDTRLRRRVDASDVAQEAILNASRRLDLYLEHPKLPFRLWLRQIAFDHLLIMRRKHIDAARRSMKRELPLPDETSVQLARAVLATGATPSEALGELELLRRVHEALDQLSPTDREVLVMRNLEGLSNVEIAQALNMNPNTVTKRYGRALLRLRSILMGECKSDE